MCFQDIDYKVREKTVLRKNYKQTALKCYNTVPNCVSMSRTTPTISLWAYQHPKVKEDFLEMDCSPMSKRIV